MTYRYTITRLDDFGCRLDTDHCPSWVDTFCKAAYWFGGLSHRASHVLNGPDARVFRNGWTYLIERHKE